MKGAIQFGSKQIDFHLKFSDRKTLGITVTPDLSVYIKAPFGSSLESVKEKLVKKAPWIIRQQSYFLTFHPKTPPKRFVGGETHLYLGRQYQLKILNSNDESVKLKGKYILVSATDKSKARQLVGEWYLINANILLFLR